MELVKHIVCLIALFTTVLSITARLYLLTQLIIDTTTTRMIDTIHTTQTSKQLINRLLLGSNKALYLLSYLYILL